MGPEEIGAIVLGAAMLVGFICWRIWMSRKGKGERHENPD